MFMFSRTPFNTVKRTIYAPKRFIFTELYPPFSLKKLPLVLTLCDESEYFLLSRFYATHANFCGDEVLAIGRL